MIQDIYKNTRPLHLGVGLLAILALLSGCSSDDSLPEDTTGAFLQPVFHMSGKWRRNRCRYHRRNRVHQLRRTIPLRHCKCYRRYLDRRSRWQGNETRHHYRRWRMVRRK